ncbi:MAG: undecaprenyl/decaprenyl-phosphate alpha-N-acetylglucosaminyl 1-phosphate transferase [Bacilli bacterium]|nr:undecaprenyl/decaprenyl-phosphate alpha-N-acetylglucosaminyl 1-phosphate transferase [Bacilli bacterium]
MVDKYLIELILIMLITFVFTAVIIPGIIRIAKHINAIDVPKDNRRVHTKPIPKLGGLAIFGGFLFGYMLFGVHSIQMNSILIGSFIIIITGIIDDINPISAKYKMLGQFCAALSIMFYGNILLDEVTVFGQIIHFGTFAYPITLLFILGCINIINLIDGLDGLSGGITSIFLITMGVIAFIQGRQGTLEITLIFITLGSVLGFLLHNFNPAKIFAGDTGSMFMGFIIAIVSLLGFKGAMFLSFMVPLAVLAIPILDTLFAIFRRMLKKKPIFEADKDHMHHQLLKMNFSQRKTVLIIYVINILFSLAAIFFTVGDARAAIVIYFILLILTIWFILHTGILSQSISDKIKCVEDKILNNKTKKQS